MRRLASLARADAPAGPGGPFGIYIHVPFCATRCGYCDFNTYTAGELGGANPAGLARRAADRAGAGRRHLGEALVDTVFVGGGTPSLLGGDGLAAVLDAVRDNFTLAPDAEVTTEANPESTSLEFFERDPRRGLHPGVTGYAVGGADVLTVLDRIHSPGRALHAAAEARRPASNTSTST